MWSICNMCAPCNYKVELRSGVELSVSRQYYTAIRSAWLEWKGQFGDE